MNFHLTPRSVDASSPKRTVLSVRCPACGQRGTFEGIEAVPDLWDKNAVCLFGQRYCPNDECKAHVFFVERQRELLALYPPLRLTFDASGVPEVVKSSLEEAISCHAVGAFRAAAIMVRRTLEELCEDRGAQGNDLKARIRALGNVAVLPAALLDGMDHLRLLGNDAAHLESKTYDSIGAKEIEVAVRFAKTVLRAAYQYAGLLEELKALQKPKA